jgi:hypothetical protein
MIYQLFIKTQATAQSRAHVLPRIGNWTSNSDLTYGQDVQYIQAIYLRKRNGYE